MSQVLEVLELQQMSVNTLRFLSIDAIEDNNSGHPGLALGAAPMAYVLWKRILKHYPGSPQWFDRDRFILSANHGSALLYSLLHLCGYPTSIEQVRNFQLWQNSSPAESSLRRNMGIEFNYGGLGQGFANAVGMAMTEANLSARYNQGGYAIVDHHTFGIVSEADLMEGVSSGSAAVAGALELGKLILLHDCNGMSSSRKSNLAFTESIALRFDAYGWQTLLVHDGNDIEELEQAMRRAQSDRQRPSLILIETDIAYGSANRQDSLFSHHVHFGAEEFNQTKRNFGWPEEPKFHVPIEVQVHYLEVADRGRALEGMWRAEFSAYEEDFPHLAVELKNLMRDQDETFDQNFDATFPVFPVDAHGIASRTASACVLERLIAEMPNLIGASACSNPEVCDANFDASESNSWRFHLDGSSFSRSYGCSFAGTTVQYGGREHAMAGIMNGMAAHGGVVPFGTTSLACSDYMRPAIRLAALAGQHVIYVFTHGQAASAGAATSHPAIDQLAGLRAIPGLLVIRPSDANETAAAWRVAIQSGDRPVALVLTPEKIPTLDRNEFRQASDLQCGAYTLLDSGDDLPDIILIANGPELSLAIAAQGILQQRHVHARVVSMPCWELFEEQSHAYRERILPRKITARLAIEDGIAQGWHRYVGDGGDVLCIDSAAVESQDYEHAIAASFTVESICTRALALLARSNSQRR